MTFSIRIITLHHSIYLPHLAIVLLIQIFWLGSGVINGYSAPLESPCLGTSLTALQLVISRLCWRTCFNLGQRHASCSYSCNCRLQRRNSSVDDYILKIRGYADQLAAAGKNISDNDLILVILRGFVVEFESVVVNLTTRSYVLNLQEVQYVLQAQEI